MLNCKKWKIVRKNNSSLVFNSYLVQANDGTWTAIIFDSNNTNFKYITRIHEGPLKTYTCLLYYISGKIQNCVRDEQHNVVYYEEEEPIYYV